MLRRLVEFVAWFAGLVAALALLVFVGRFGLALPSLHISEWKPWLESSDPAITIFALARAGALVAVVYLLASSLLLAMATVLRIKPVIAVATLIATPSVRRVIRATVGLSVAGVLATPALASASTPTTVPPDAPVLIHLGPNDTIPPVSTTVVVPPPVPAHASAPAPASTTTHVVVHGDNLWSISRHALSADLGRSPTESELRSYWNTVIEANRDALSQPDNANLIFPGQVIQLPPASLDPAGPAD